MPTRLFLGNVHISKKKKQKTGVSNTYIEVFILANLQRKTDFNKWSDCIRDMLFSMYNLTYSTKNTRTALPYSKVDYRLNFADYCIYGAQHFVNYGDNHLSFVRFKPNSIHFYSPKY